MNDIVVLDRDGVINVDLMTYVTSPQEFEPIKGSLEAIARLNEKGFKIAIATNQACIEKGIITDNELDSIHNYMIELLKPLGGSVDYIAYCPHAPETNCDCRKPKTGLLKNAEKKHGISLKDCYFVGDKLSDIECALAHGCKPILVETGYGTRSIAERGSREDLIIVKNLREAVKKIIKES